MVELAPETVHPELPFAGFTELIRAPLEERDPRSFERIRRLFLSEGEARTRRPFSFLLQRLTGRAIEEGTAREHWRRILSHKNDMESKLGRVVAVQAAAVDYISGADEAPASPRPERSAKPAAEADGGAEREEWTLRMYGQAHYLVRLKEEILRAHRYNHALSAILLDIDDFHLINERYSSATGDQLLLLVVNIIKKAVRTVDFVARFSADRFIVILPNTNKREANELAARIERVIGQRAARRAHLGADVSVTLAVGQNDKDESATEFIRRIDHLLMWAKEKRGQGAKVDGTT